MFNAEKLLGKVVSEVMGSGYGKKKKKKKHKKNVLVDNLKSGAGLMTAIGLGIGAYEILRSKSQTPPATTPTATPPPPSGTPISPPPPPPPQSASPPATPQPFSLPAEDLATRMLQVMIAAAHADGTMDEKEELAVLERLKGADLSQEERMFLLTELHNPRPIADLTADITDPAAAKAMYMLAASTIEIDTASERQWLDQLAARLGISKAVQSFIEEQS